MREILFRGFHKDENGKETIYLNGEEIKGEWVYGSLVIHRDILWKNQKYYYIETDTGEDRFEVIQETVGQYTGLDDKNSKKIFENDVLSGVHYKFIVKWNKHRMGFEVFTFMEEINEGIPVNVKDIIPFEVIGTIFDKEVK